MSRLSLAIAGFVLLLLISATDARAQCNSHPFRPSMLPPCPTIASELSRSLDLANDANKLTAELNKAIELARQNFFARFPDKPGIDDAEAGFAQKLREKDSYYVMFAVQGGMDDPITRVPNLIGYLGGTVAEEDLNKFPKTVDHGIRPYAMPLFVDWIYAVRRAEGREKEGALTGPTVMAEAYFTLPHWRESYEDARNWAEFLSSGLDLSRFMTGPEYILQQMEADVMAVIGLSKPTDLPDPVAATRAFYDLFVKMFGEKEVVAAATATLSAPKNSIGGLATRANVEVGPYITNPSPNPLTLFLTKVTTSSPRAYAIALCLDRSNFTGSGGYETIVSKAQWDKAFSVFTQLGAKYGEATVVAAAARLMPLEKNTSGELRADNAHNSIVYWFDALIKNPKAVIPDGAVAQFKASSYDAHWVGQSIKVRGTVARVDLAKGQFPPYATIHFKESPDTGILAFTPNSDMLQERFGETFVKLIGQPIEVFGQVLKWQTGAGVRIVTADQLKVLDSPAAVSGFEDSHPAWLSGPLPVDKPAAAAAPVDAPAARPTVARTTSAPSPAPPVSSRQTPAATPTPTSTPAPAVAPAPAGAPDATRETEIRQQYGALFARANKAIAALDQYQRTKPVGDKLPQAVLDARTDVMLKLRAVPRDLAVHQPDAADQDLHAAEADVKVIEAFLAK